MDNNGLVPATLDPADVEIVTPMLRQEGFLPTQSGTQDVRRTQNIPVQSNGRDGTNSSHTTERCAPGPTIPNSDSLSTTAINVVPSQQASDVAIHKSYPVLTMTNYNKITVNASYDDTAEPSEPLHDAQRSQIQQLQKQLEADEHRAHSYRNTIEQLRTENSNLTELLLASSAKYSRQVKIVVALGETSDHFESQYHAERRKNDDLKDENDRLNETIVAKQSEVQQWRTSAADVQLEFDTYRERVRSSREEDKQTVQECRDENVRMRGEFMIRLQGQTLERDLLQDSLDDSNRKLLQAEKRLTVRYETPQPIAMYSVHRTTQPSPILHNQDQRQDENVIINWDEHNSNAWKMIDVSQRTNSGPETQSKPTNIRPVRSIPETRDSMEVSGGRSNHTISAAMTSHDTPRLTESPIPITRGPGAMATCSYSQSTPSILSPSFQASPTCSARDNQEDIPHSAGTYVPAQKRKSSVGGVGHDCPSDIIGVEQGHQPMKRPRGLQFIENPSSALNVQQRQPLSSISATVVKSSGTTALETNVTLDPADFGQSITGNNLIAHPAASKSFSTPSLAANDDDPAMTCMVKFTDLFTDRVLDEPLTLLKSSLRSQIDKELEDYLLRGQAAARSGGLDKCCRMRFKKRQTIETQPQTACSVCERQGMFCLRMDISKADEVVIVPLNDSIRSGGKADLKYWVRKT